MLNIVCLCLYSKGIEIVKLLLKILFNDVCCKYVNYENKVGEYQLIQNNKLSGEIQDDNW